MSTGCSRTRRERLDPFTYEEQKPNDCLGYVLKTCDSHSGTILIKAEAQAGADQDIRIDNNPHYPDRSDASWRISSLASRRACLISRSISLFEKPASATPGRMAWWPRASQSSGSTVRETWRFAPIPRRASSAATSPAVVSISSRIVRSDTPCSGQALPQAALCYSNPSCRKLTQRPFPTITWSCRTIDSAVSAAPTWRVMAMSAAEGVGSPLG